MWQRICVCVHVLKAFSNVRWVCLGRIIATGNAFSIKDERPTLGLVFSHAGFPSDLNPFFKDHKNSEQLPNIFLIVRVLSLKTCKAFFFNIAKEN